MADIEANIGINLDTSRALAQLKNLQRQISVFNTEIARGGGKAAAAAAGMQQELVNSINATGQFSASMTSVRSTTESFTNALEKNKLSLGQTFRYAGAASKKFSHLFTSEFNTIEKVARERVKTIQTQYIKMGRDANGAIRSIAVRPLALDMNNLATQTAMAAQKQQILNQLLRQGSTNLLNWGKNTQWAGRQLMVGFTIPLALFGAAASKSFMELEEQAIRFKRVYGDLFTTPQQADQAFADMQRLGQEFTKYGVAVEKTIGLAASVAQMGKTGAELTAQVTEATRLAVLGGMEQEDALNTTISLTNAFGVATEDLTNKINFLNAAENQTILSIQDFNEAVPRAGSVVAQLGGDVEDLAFFLTAMREGGIEASQGANALKTSLGRLVNPTRRAREELMAYGIDVVGIVERNAGNLRQTVLDLGMALEQLDPLEKSRAVERLFGKFQFARMSALFNNIMDEGSQAATILDLINSSAADLSTIAGRELGRVEESAATKFRSAIEQFQLALAPIGESFLKLVTPIIEFGTKVLNAFNNLSDGTKTFVVGLVATLGAIGPVLIMTVGLLANGIANLMKIFLGLQSVFQKIRGGTKNVADQTEYMTQQQLEAAAAAASLNQSHSTLQQTFTSELAAVNNLVAAYQRMTTAQRNVLGIPQMVAPTTRAPGFAKGRKVPGYKDGVVMVPGPKGAGDIQPAMLAPGEAVIPAEMAEKYGPLINAMIAGNIPGYMAGRTSAKTGGVSYDASHLAGLNPEALAATIKMLADAGYRFEGVVDTITTNADGLGRTITRAKGYIDEFVDPGQMLFAGGSSYAGTAIPEESARNQQMYNAFGIEGSWKNTDELFQQAELLSQAQAENTQAYQKNKAAVDALLLEAQEAKAALSQSTDQEKARLSIEQQRAKQAIEFGLIADQKVDAEQAEIISSEAIKQSEEIYLRAVREGYSTQEALNDARLNLLYETIRLGGQSDLHFGAAGDTGVTSDVLRAFITGRGTAATDPVRLERKRLGLPAGTSDVFTREYEGPRAPRGGLSAREVMSEYGPKFENIGIEAVREATKKILDGARKATKQASPSKEAEKVGANIGRGAILGMDSQVDEAQVAGQNLGQAVTEGFNNFPAAGATPGTRGGKGRVRTAGEFTTPGQPPAFDIVGGQAVQNTQKQFLTLGQRVTEAGTKLSSMSMKLGSAGIAVSSLVGGLSMVDGPLGDFAAKLFPITSALTALSFATQMLNEKTLEGIGNRVDEAVAAGVKAKSDAREALASNAAATADTREAAASNAAAAADAREAVASNMAALAGSRIALAFSRVISVAKGLFTGIGTLLGRVGLVVAGLAVLAGGIYLLNKLYQDQQAKINGLGDAAKLSGDNLKTLNDILGAELAERQIGGVGGTGAEGTGARTGDEETQQSAQDIQNQLLESEEFEKEFGSVISSLEGASIAAAEQALTSMALTLQTAGASEEMIAGIVNALLVAAGKTDIVLDFSSITLGTAQQSAADAANQYAESFSTAAKNISDEDIVTRASTTAASGVELYAGDIGGVEAEAERQLAAGALSSLILDANEQLRQGLIDITEYNAAIATVGDTIGGIADTDPKGLAAASLLVAQMAQDMEAAGFEGAAEDVQSFLDLNTAAGLTAATTVMSARASGTEISEGEMGALTAGAREGATAQDIIDSEIAIAAINSRTAATVKLTQAEKELGDARETTAAFETEVEKQNAAIQGQIDTYNDVSDAIANNSEIQDKNAFAQKIAADETLRNAWAAAQLQDAETGNTEATQNFIAAMQEQSAMQDQLNAQQALADIENAITQKQRETNVTDALGIALGDSAEAQGIMNNAQAMSFVLSELAAQGFNTAEMAAEDLAAAIKDSNILTVLDAMSKSGAFDFAPKTTSGGGGTPKSFLDDIVKGLRDVASGQTTVTNGFKSSLRALVAFSKAGVKGLNGLSSQLRKAGVTGTFAEKILGMDPKDWERQKRELFNFDAAGNITGLTAAGQAVQDALGVIEIGRFIDEQENVTVSVSNQIEALNRLTGAGASYEAAYKAVQNTAFAAAVATAKSSEQIQAAAEAAMTAMAKMKELEEINEEEERKNRIRDAVREQNKEFSNQAKILDYITNNRSKLSEAQITEVLNNKDLQSLVLEPSIDPGALSTALANAQKQADLELRIKKLTVEGQEDIFQEGFSSAMSAFGALEEEIELEFRARIKDDDSLVKDAERQIALIDFELDDYQAGLDEIDRLEQDINDVYDKRIEALDEVATLNEDIARAQESQLEIADALSKGDIAAAARAAQQSRQVQQESAREAQQRMLEEQRASEIARLRSSSGMSREELQDRIRDLEEQIFNIEERTLEPAQERIRLAEITRDDQVASLEVLGRTREEWDKISNSVDVAQANGWRFADAMQESLNIVEKLVDNLVNRPLPPPPAPAPAPQSSGGGGGGDPFPPKDQWKLANGQPLSTIVPPGQSWQQYYNANRDKLDNQLTPPAKRAYGGIVGRSRSGPPQQYFGGGKVSGPGTEKSDSIPALLSNGEYVIRASSVRLLGKDFLDKLNGGKVVPDEKNGLPAFRTGGFVNTGTLAGILKASTPAPKKYTPPISIRQAERAASKPSLPKAPLISAGKNVPPPAPTRRPSTASAPRTTAPAPAPRPAPAPAVMTQDTRTPLKKAIDSLSNTFRTSGIANYIPNPVEIIKNVGEFFLPVTSSQIGSDGPSSVAPIRRGATDNSLADDLLGMPFAGDLALYAAGSAAVKPVAAALGMVGRAIRVPTVAVPGATRPSGNTIVSPNATTIRQQQEAIAAETARIIDDKVAEGVATGQIPKWTESGGFRDRLAIDSYKRALVESDRLSSGPIMTPGQEVLDNTTHISDLSPTDLLNVAKAHVSKKSLDEIVSPYMVRTDNQRTFIASANPIENLLAKMGITTKAKREIEDNLRFLNTAPDFLTDPENAAILRNMILPQLGTYPKFVTGRQSSAFVSGSGAPNTLRKIGGVGGISGSTRLGPLSAFMGKQATREDLFTLGHENAHIVQKLYERLGLRSPTLPSPRDFNYGLFSNARLESGARLTDSLYDQAMGGTGNVIPYLGFNLDDIVAMSLNPNTPAGRKAIEEFAKTYIVPNAPRGFQFNANWFEEYFAGISSSTIKSPHSFEQMRETLRLSQSLRKAGLTNQTSPSERAGAMMRMVWNEISENGMVRPGKDLMARQMAFNSVISKEASKRSNRLKKTRSLSPSLAPRQSSEFIEGSSLKRLKNPPEDVEYEPGAQLLVSDFAEDSLGNKFFVKGHLKESWEAGVPDTVSSSFINEFLAGRIGNYIGANTPQSYIVKRSAGDVAIGTNMRSNIDEPFEIATGVVPSSHSLDPEYMRTLVLMSDNPYKTIEELFDGFIDYSRTTPALNAVMGNSDLHYNNILWSNATKKFNQIDFNEAKPVALKMAPGIKGPHPQVRDALVIAKSSMALIRESLNDAVEAALESQLLTQSQQLALIGRMNASGFKLTANKNATDPLSDTVLDITTTQDYTKLFEKIASSDGENYIPRALKGEWRGIKGGTRVVDPWVLKNIQERAEVLSEFGRVSLDVGDYGMMAQRMAVRGKGFMAGGLVRSVNTDRIPAMLTAGEYVVKRSAVQNFGTENLEKINNGTYNDGSVYNYNLAVNVKSDADPNKIARTVITNIKGIENQRVRGNRL